MVFLLVAVGLGRIVRFEHIESLCEEKNITVSRMGEAPEYPAYFHQEKRPPSGWSNLVVVF